jgi:hypothetical protein
MIKGAPQSQGYSWRTDRSIWYGQTVAILPLTVFSVLYRESEE